MLTHHILKLPCTLVLRGPVRPGNNTDQEANVKILVTGASGFLARNLLQRLAEDERCEIVTLSRKNGPFEDLDGTGQAQSLSTANFRSFLEGVDAVVHTAARAHVLKETLADPLGEFRKTNVGFTLNLARQSASLKVKRFIHISSIGVHGINSRRPFTPDDTLAPEEPYAISKLEAEQGLKEICQDTGMELVIIRPPLVYGPGAPGNFAQMIRWIGSGIPLPLGAIENRRSLISVYNLADLISICIEHPAAAGKILLACDGEDVSTSELLRRLSRAMKRPARLFPVPASILELGATLLGKKALARRVLGSLQIDMSSTTGLLDWTPPLTLDQGLSRCFDPD